MIVTRVPSRVKACAILQPMVRVGSAEGSERVQPRVTPDPAPHVLDVYWRPGCLFCSSLKRSLRRRKVPMRLHNIWEDPEAADTVRAAARGNETVPTVAIGGEVLVNPTPQAVEALIARVAPDLLPPQPDSTGRKRFWSRR